jgi:putative phosphoesterase
LEIGIIADTHDNLPQVAKAVELFNHQRVDLVLHAGDFVAPFAAREFTGLQMRLTGVFGNNDGDKLLLLNRLKGKGELYEDYHELELEGKKIVLMHQPKFLEALIASRRYDLIVYGHTHQIDIREGSPLVINPGECCGWTTGNSTVAIVDLDTMKAIIHVL